MLQKHGWRVDRFIHNYFYFLYYYPYVAILRQLVLRLPFLGWCKPIVPLGKMIFNRYHAKVLSYKDTRKIFSLNEDLQYISDENKKIVPYKYATKIIFQEPENIVVMDCPCKKACHAPAEDINSCLAVGKSITSFWLEHCQKYHPRKISQEEAIRIIEQFRKKKHITQAFFKVATGGSTGVICNCHPDTCVSLQATKFSRRISRELSMTAQSGYSVAVDEGKCVQCGTCADMCGFEAMTFENGHRVYRRDLCMGCELCVENCPENALSLYSDPEKLQPLDLDIIREKAGLMAGDDLRN
jgi:ferredoxin